jgi:hypothetical protein
MLNRENLCKKTVEFVDDEKIVLNFQGRFPFRIILNDLGEPHEEYRLCKTKQKKLVLNK